ncbi:peptide-methionine (S)-S-oxide reductase MsrA [Alienimonas californiensis]|uniref:Peptide methionine sulfoxide reductase MsrA n=1 Tax=Alienimonas californiensis TaxID=2527989 RepID=A0A517P810_9PLAN|nr:peptide-methionine (S)-S-oxide reductase MsrA [Alienimonas californiensis]QDT15509.1 Peptide methionine sulfoxide reductase MsrA [Alienimonas californiensis]
MTALACSARRLPILSAAALAAAALAWAPAASAVQPPLPTADAAEGTGEQDGRASAIFAGGCFWCMESPFDKLDGVISTTSGYTAGRLEDPTYYQVTTGRTGHTEAIKVVYDPQKVSYETLLNVFWRNVDPFQQNRQFVDRGNQYRTGVYYTPEQKAAAEASLKQVQQRFDRKVATELAEAGPFYEAEAYHQDFYKTNPARYNAYAASCGRVEGLNKIWGEEAGGASIIQEHNAKAAAGTPAAE